MLQKTYWMGQIKDERIQASQQIRMFFCKHQFFVDKEFNCLPAFLIKDGGLISNTYGWALVINNFFFPAPGSALVQPDDVVEQIRRLLILKLNFLIAKSPEEVEKLCNTKSSIGSDLIPSQILPEFFSNKSRNIVQEIKGVDSWIKSVMLFPREKYDALLTALAAYERAFHVLSADPTLAYALLVFAIEALANNHQKYQALWEDIKGETGKRLNYLFEDQRISSVNRDWIDEFKQTLVNILHPGAMSRFIRFALDHISNNFFEASQTNSKHPLRKTRLDEGIKNAYSLRSSFAHELTPLNQKFISQSLYAEEVEYSSSTYITLRGMFRVTRSILLDYINCQTDIYPQAELEKYLDGWVSKVSSGTIESRNPAYLNIKGDDGKVKPLKAEDSKIWFEDILSIYQENYIERYHDNLKQNGVGMDLLLGVATSGSYAGRFLFRADPSPSYNWKEIQEQALKLIPTAKTVDKGYLRAIALLCCCLSKLKLDGAEDTANNWDNTVANKKFGTSIMDIERFVVDIIHQDVTNWSAEKAEEVVKKHLNKLKLHLPSRVEIACLLQVARLFQIQTENEESDLHKREWLKIAYHDTASYPEIQSLIEKWEYSVTDEIDPQAILSVQDPS